VKDVAVREGEPYVELSTERLPETFTLGCWRDAVVMTKSAKKARFAVVAIVTVELAYPPEKETVLVSNPSAMTLE
jgi:hypothetical protein